MSKKAILYAHPAHKVGPDDFEDAFQKAFPEMASLRAGNSAENATPWQTRTVGQLDIWYVHLVQGGTLYITAHMPTDRAAAIAKYLGGNALPLAGFRSHYKRLKEGANHPAAPNWTREAFLALCINHPYFDHLTPEGYALVDHIPEDWWQPRQQALHAAYEELDNEMKRVPFTSGLTWAEMDTRLKDLMFFLCLTDAYRRFRESYTELTAKLGLPVPYLRAA